MSEHTIEVTDVDALRLNDLLAGLAPDSGPKQSARNSLAHELQRARIVPAHRIGRRVVTMECRVLLEDMDTHESATYTLVQPEQADFEAGRLSVLAPIGTAILGYREGDVVEWPVPAGVRRIRIKKVLYQPEAAGRQSMKSKVATRASSSTPMTPSFSQGRSCRLRTRLAPSASAATAIRATSSQTGQPLANRNSLRAKVSREYLKRNSNNVRPCCAIPDRW